MKRTTVTTIMSIITILFIFSSMSYAATKEEWKKAHNSRRYWHGAPAVEWSDKLAVDAKTCIDNWNGVHCNSGQNYTGCTTPESAVADWYSEEPDYVKYVGYGNEPKTKTVNGWTSLDDPNKGKYLHFTQVVWKSTKLIGCATGAAGTICNYDVGNVATQFKQNVGYNFFPFFQAWIARILKFQIITIP